MAREQEARSDESLEKFKLDMIAAHPEFSEEILKDFDELSHDEWADPLSDEEMESLGPMDAHSLEEALRQMQDLGVGLE